MADDYFLSYKWWKKVLSESNKITTSLLFRILTITLISIGLYHYLYGYKDRNYGIDELKYFLILDKNAKLSDMRCRKDAKYSFYIKSKPILQNSLIGLFRNNGWKSYEKYSFIDLVKNNVKISMSVGEKYKTNTSVILIWQ